MGSAPHAAEGRRALWGRAGVADDELSTSVLAVGLRPEGEGPVAGILRICAGSGRPVSLTLAQLRPAARVVERGGRLQDCVTASSCPSGCPLKKSTKLCGARSPRQRSRISWASA
ncbi:TIGR02679 domain-containing protein [Kitasatospora sp. NPDC004669]|uniref:TIGR02679 domain-containing protein n=1 Tax=Kitasatospora sp. NPDC004669 TaxID=3154555 RepID=UPI0033A00E37